MSKLRDGTVNYRTVSFSAGITTFPYHTVSQKTVWYPKNTFLFKYLEYIYVKTFLCPKNVKSLQSGFKRIRTDSEHILYLKIVHLNPQFFLPWARGGCIYHFILISSFKNYGTYLITTIFKQKLKVRYLVYKTKRAGFKQIRIQLIEFWNTIGIKIRIQGYLRSKTTVLNKI